MIYAYLGSGFHKAATALSFQSSLLAAENPVKTSAPCYDIVEVCGTRGAAQSAGKPVSIRVKLKGVSFQEPFTTGLIYVSAA